MPYYHIHIIVGHRSRGGTNKHIIHVGPLGDRSFFSLHIIANIQNVILLQSLSWQSHIPLFIDPQIPHRIKHQPNKGVWYRKTKTKKNISLTPEYWHDTEYWISFSLEASGALVRPAPLGGDVGQSRCVSELSKRGMQETMNMLETDLHHFVPTLNCSNARPGCDTPLAHDA